MPVHVKTQVLSRFSRPGRLHYAQQGDFAELSGLYPDHTRNKLKRAPGWSAHVPWPETATTFEGFTDCNVVITNPDSNYFVFIGKLTTPANHLASVHWDRDNKTLADRYDMTLDLGAYFASAGYHGRAAMYFAGDLFIISLDFDLHFGANLAAAPTDSYAGTFGVVVAYGDKVFLADKNQGLIYRLNAAATDFDLYYTPRTYLKIQTIFPYHQYLCVIAKHSDGRIGIYRIPDIYVQTAHEIGHIPNSTGRYASGSQYSAGNPYAMVGEYIYLLTGYQNPIESPLMGLYSFDGTRIRHVTDVTDIPAQADCQSMGLLDWRGNLILWALDDTLTTHTLKMLVGDRFIDFSSLSGVLPTLAAVYNAGGDLVIICEDDSNNEGFKHTLGRMNGHIITSKMDMGQPGRPKNLHNITAMLDGAAADFFVKLYYRTEDTAAWMQAGVTAEDTHRAAAADLDVEFYQLQVKVELDDDSGNDEDIAIEKIGITYSIDLG